MVKRLAVKIFRLNDIRDMLVEAKQNQKKNDDKYWQDILEHELAKMQRIHELQIQEKDSEITMLHQTIIDFKKRERELDNKEFFVTKQVKENVRLSVDIAAKTKEIGLQMMRFVGDIEGIKDIAEQHQKKIEQRS